jgi:hypothetical protein
LSQKKIRAKELRLMGRRREQRPQLCAMRGAKSDLGICTRRIQIKAARSAEEGEISCKPNLRKIISAYTVGGERQSRLPMQAKAEKRYGGAPSPNLNLARLRSKGAGSTGTEEDDWHLPVSSSFSIPPLKFPWQCRAFIIRWWWPQSAPQGAHSAAQGPKATGAPGGPRDYGQLRGCNRKTDRVPRFLFFLMLFVWPRKEAKGIRVRVERSDESNRAGSRKFPGAMAGAEADPDPQCGSQAAGWSRRTGGMVVWCGSGSKGTYDEAAVELVLEVGADVGVGEEVRRHGGARPVLSPPRVALVVVRRRRHRRRRCPGWPGRGRRLAHSLPSPGQPPRGRGGWPVPVACVKFWCAPPAGATPLEVPIFRASRHLVGGFSFSPTFPTFWPSGSNPLPSHFIIAQILWFNYR